MFYAKGGAGIMWASRNLTKQDSFLSLSDGELYAGVYVDFMGTDSAIFRTLGTKTAMRTDQYNSRWLNGNTTLYLHSSFPHYFFLHNSNRTECVV